MVWQGFYRAFHMEKDGIRVAAELVRNRSVRRQFL
jgi:hypothetical protein